MKNIVGKAIYLDMDGTIFDLFNVPNWLEKLRNNDVSPYADAAPIVNLDRLGIILDTLQRKGFRTGIISWGSLDATPQYMAAIRQVKKEAIRKIPHRFDELHIVKYGVPKHKICHIKNGILIDDNGSICEDWTRAGGVTIQAHNEFWLDNLEKLC